MRYRNKRTGTIAEPSAEVAALNFAHNSDWEEIVEEVNAKTDLSHEAEIHKETPPDETEAPEDEGGEVPEDEKGEMPETEGEEETECSQSEQTATSPSDTPMNTSEDTTDRQAPTENDGKPSAKRKGKASSKPPVKN